MDEPVTGLELWVIKVLPDGSIETILIGTVVDGRLIFPDES
jgi:hypothetical protein